MGGGGEVAQRQAISGYNEGRAGTIEHLRGDFGRGWWIGGG
jgi:hypothetical protein